MERKSFQEDLQVQKHRWIILAAVGMFTFMATLDGSIVNIALPTISKDVSVPMNQTEWVVSIYLIVVCACLLLFGKIGDAIGKIKIFKVGTFIFVFGSFLCGIHLSLEFLLFARVVQAIGASMTMSTNSGIITEVFPLKERGRALGMIGSFVSLGAIAGPGIGGVILAHLSWPYIFWINIPIGILTIILGTIYLPKDIQATKDPIDFKGFIAFAIFILGLFGAIFIGQETGFLKAPIVAMFVISMLALGLFWKIEQRQPKPLVEFSIFKNKTFTISLLAAVCIFVANFFSNVLLPFYLQNVRGFSASHAGLLMMVFPLVMVIGSPITGILTDKWGPQRLTLIGLGVLTLTEFGNIFLQEKTPIWFFLLLSAMMGLGNAIFQSPNNTIVMSSVEKRQLGVAGGMNAFARNFGMVVGISAATTMLYSAMSQKYGSKVITYIPSRPDVFVYGMKISYALAFGICLLATIITAYRSVMSKRK